MGGLLPAEELDPTRAAAPTAPFPLPLEDTESVLLRWWLGGTVWASERWIWGETSKKFWRGPQPVLIMHYIL